MQLSRFTDYSLRVLFYVAINNDRRATLHEIADFYQISVEHLRKVVHALSKSGHLKTYRGKNGGLRLNLPPADINLGALVSQSEGTDPLIDCEAQPCRLAGICNLQNALAEAQRAFIASLAQYSLADMLNNPRMQQQLISKSG
ncbi:RrF2 family transcriptional regulator [Marinobacterium rhizophilum]|uniref:Rrf2 family transcriptional regulator n=1 Tax=Marinobacterium rhizophilum TaxID=420402 RepID=A0ABY5HRH8_9GAMM|nr:Rrf2 family transcriptional regulator [Marinobacterium rhizophilum]UTW13521.1 Rrf2 family transcriptional regulator [Marinobacterium rhizophilum]